MDSPFSTYPLYSHLILPTAPGPDGSTAPVPGLGPGRPNPALIGVEPRLSRLRSPSPARGHRPDLGELGLRDRHPGHWPVLESAHAREGAVLGRAEVGDGIALGLLSLTVLLAFGRGGKFDNLAKE